MAFQQRQRKKNGQLKRRYYEKQRSFQKKADDKDTNSHNISFFSEGFSVNETENKGDDKLQNGAQAVQPTDNNGMIEAQIDCKILEERLSQLLSVIPIGTSLENSASDSAIQQDSSNISQIDLDQIVKSLSAIPLYQRLLIDDKLVELCEEVHQGTKYFKLFTDTFFEQQTFSHLNAGETAIDETAIMLTKLLLKQPSKISKLNISSESVLPVVSHLHQDNCVPNTSTTELDSTLDELLDI